MSGKIVQVDSKAAVHLPGPGCYIRQIFYYSLVLFDLRAHTWPSFLILKQLFLYNTTLLENNFYFSAGS